MHRPTDSARVAIFDHDHPHRFLVVIEKDDPDNWKLPGGKFENDTESPQEAAERELAEEVGVSGMQIGLRAVETIMNNDGFSARHVFTGEATPDEILPSSKEIARTAWFTEETLPSGKHYAHIISAVAVAKAFRKKQALEGGFND